MATVNAYRGQAAPLITTTLGVIGTVQGTVEIGKGNVFKGAKKTLVGLTAANLGARWAGLEHGFFQDLMKCSLMTGTGVVALEGISNTLSGLRNKNVMQIRNGAMQTALGIAGVVYLEALDSKVLLVAHQASLLTLAGYHISRSGLNDLVQGDYKKGAVKILLGAGGAACAGYYVYTELLKVDSLTPEQLIFLEKHDKEIFYLTHYENPIGSWEKIGNGVSKKVYAHPELPGSIVKFPIPNTAWRSDTDNDVRTHHMLLQRVRTIAERADFSRIVVPDCQLVETQYGPIVIEERFKMVPFASVHSPSKSKAVSQLDAFQQESGLCDVLVEWDHNAGILEGTESDPKIGVFDFDCNNGLKWNVLKKAQERHAYLMASIMAVAATKLTKAVAGIRTAKALVLLGAVGAIGIAAATLEDDPGDPLNAGGVGYVSGAVIVAIGAAIVTTGKAIVTTGKAINSLWNWACKT